MARREHDSEHLEGVADALSRMQDIIEAVLAFARQGQPIDSYEPVRLSSLVDESWGLVDTRRAELVTEADLAFLADSDRVRQLLENLFRNAVEHGGEAVTVTVGGSDDGFFVEDDGPGIPEDERGEAFESGYSTLEGGTGFGLSIVKQIVEAHGWNVRVTDGAAGGARFEITGVSFSE